MTRTYLLVGLAVTTLLLIAAPVAVSADHVNYTIEHTITTPNEVEQGEQFTVTGDITNLEDQPHYVEVYIDGSRAFSQVVDSGETAEFSHDLAIDDVGEHDLEIHIYVDNHHDTTTSGEITVVEAQEEDGGLLDIDIVDSIQEAIYAPFQALTDALIDSLTYVFTSYPTVNPNDAVQELHRLALVTTFALATLTVIVAGILFQIGPILGVSYQQVRLLLPRVLIALIFGTVSPFLLQYAVELAEALTIAFKPTSPDFWSTIRFTGGLAVISIINALLLLAVAALFIVRDFYILFAAAASPLIALGWAMPYSRQYATSLIGTFWGFLLIGPLDMIVFRLILELLKTPGNQTPEWLTALGGFVMLL